MKLLLKGLGGVLLIGAVLLAIFLVPAHLQVREVEPALPSTTELRELLSVEDGPVRIRYVNTSSQKLPVGEMGHTVFIVEWADGRLFMVDTGMDPETAVEFGQLMESALGADEAISHGTIADLLGANTQRVQGVAYTHLHKDHTQGTISFCEARGSGAKRFQTPQQADMHNFNTTEGAEIVADSCLNEGQLHGEGVMGVDGFPGLGMVVLGGHTPGSTLYAIPVDGRLWLLSGDIANSKADLLSNTGKGFLYSYLLVPEHVDRSEELRLWLAGLDEERNMTVIVSHDLLDIQATGLAELSR